MIRILSIFLFLILFQSMGYGQIIPQSVLDSLEQASQTTEITTKQRVKKLRPLRLGLRIGVPNAATVNLEYVTPLWNNRIAVTGDFMTFKKGFDEGLFDLTIYEVGTNIYFNNRGKGFYGGLSYFSLDSNLGFRDHFDNLPNNDGHATFKFNTFNVKIGYKVGRTVYFRTEIGYGFGSIPTIVRVNSMSVQVYDYDDVPKVFGLSSSGILVFNIGFGVGLF